MEKIKNKIMMNILKLKVNKRILKRGQKMHI